MTRFGYIRTSRHLQEGVAGMDPFSQELRLRESGVQRDHVHRDIGVSSFVITSNRAVEEWLSLFDDSILGNSALDRLANASFQIVIEGASYREKLSPHRKLLGDRGGD